MRAIVVIGYKKSDKGLQPENIYTGVDGNEAHAAAEKARKSGSFVQITRLTNPLGTPLPVHPDDSKSSGAPRVVAPPARKPAIAPKTKSIDSATPI